MEKGKSLETDGFGIDHVPLDASLIKDTLERDKNVKSQYLNYHICKVHIWTG
jgi:hypothetical protein